MWSDPAGTPYTFNFDCSMNETIELVSTTTEHPVEDGVNVADHVKRELNRYSIEVHVTQTPFVDVNGYGGSMQLVTLKPPQADVPRFGSADFVPTPGAITNAVGSAIRGLISGPKPTTLDVQVFKWDRDIDFVLETMKVLEKIRDDVSLVEVFTASGRILENMHLEAIEIVTNADTGAGSDIRLSFRELRKVAVKLVTAPIPTEIRAAKEVNKGKQGTAEVTGPKKTLAKGIVDQIRGRK